MNKSNKNKAWFFKIDNFSGFILSGGIIKEG